MTKYCWCPALAASLPRPYADSSCGPDVARQLSGIVGGAGLDLLDGARRVDADRDDESLESVRAIAVVVGVPLENELLPRGVRRDVVRPGGRDGVETADGGRSQRDRTSRIVREVGEKAPSGRDSRIVSVSPRATTPEIPRVLPATYAR